MSQPPALALIVAGGRGARAGDGLPKQYRMLGGLPVLRRTILAFLNHPLVDYVRVVIHPDDRSHYEIATAGLTLLPPVEGGPTRQESVHAGLGALLEEFGQATVLIHDAARPLISKRLIDRCLDEAAVQRSAGRPVAAIPALPVTDSLRRGDGRLTEEVDRAGLQRVQTPQCFDLAAITALHRQAAESAAALTDDAALAIKAGWEVVAVQGEEANLKVTTTEDFARAEGLLAAATSVRTGLGFDVHAFEEGDGVWIGGVHIPHGRSLKGHSDADVGLHAVTDAVLGALAAGDIGDHFPPSDPQWRGAPSSIFLDHARQLAKARGARIEHVDLTIICEAPRIGPHRDAIRARVADLLQVTADRISVKATTTEKLGFTGRSEGIAAQAIATLRVREDTE